MSISHSGYGNPLPNFQLNPTQNPSSPFHIHPSESPSSVIVASALVGKATTIIYALSHFAWTLSPKTK